MPALRACLILAVTGAVAWAAPLSLQLSTTLDWNEGIVQRCELRDGDFRFAAAANSDLALVEQIPSILVGLSSPWLRVGPLSPAGSLREACNPLGFMAGSDVFVQRTGFVLDESFPAQPSGVLLMPLARALGVFSRPLVDGGEWIGCMASVFHRPGLSMEGFLSVSDPQEKSAGEEWFSSYPPFAGGRVLSTGARLLVETGPFGTSATVGTSGGEMSPPGCFCHLHAGVRIGVVRFFLLLGWADPSYLTPAGEHSAEASLASAALLFSGALGSADVRISRTVGHPAFSPQPCAASRSEASFKVETTRPTAGETLLLARVEGGMIIHHDPDGGRNGASRYSATLGARVSPFRLEAGASSSETEGLSLLTTTEAFVDHRGSRARLEGSVLHLGEQACALTALFSFRLERPGFRFALGAGVADMELRAALRDFARSMRLSLEWTSREIIE